MPRSLKHNSIELEPGLEVAVGRVTQQRPSAGFRRVLNVAEGSQLLSRSQCRIWLADGRVVIRDTSTNGTFVDGREIGRDKTVELTAGCTVTFLVNTVEEKDLEFGTEIPSFKVELRKPPRRLRDKAAADMER